MGGRGHRFDARHEENYLEATGVKGKKKENTKIAATQTAVHALETPSRPSLPHGA